MKARLGLATLLWAAVAIAGEARADDDAPARALALHDEAKALYAEGRYRDAVDKLEEAAALDPEAKILHYNLGLIEEKLGRLDRAIAHYRRCLALEIDPIERAQLEQVIGRLEGAKTHESVTGAPAPRVVAPEPQPRVAPPPAPVPSGPSPWIFVTGGVAVSAVVTAVVLATRAASIDPKDGAKTTASIGIAELEADADEAHRLAVGADVLLAVAAAGTVATIVIALTPSDSTAMALALAPGRGSLRWRF